ncbi:hypothetical protein OAB88_07695 [Winogradskyella sp.]|nr:hypothetical protein [Winogradskyella sp.]
MKIDWKYIILFVLIAFGISYLVQQGYLTDFFLSITKNSFISESEYLLAGLSTLIATIIVLTFHQNLSKRITILGDDKIKNVLILVLPILLFP